MDVKSTLKDLRERSLSDVGKRVLAQGLHSDFTLQCEGQSFPCHKSILAAHSDVFAAMFVSSMSEMESNELLLEDMNAKSVDAFLKFLYHGDINSPIVNSNVAYDLLRAAHKYQIQTLETVALELLLIENEHKFEISTALHMFAFCGQVTSFKALQERVVQVIKVRAEELADSDEYQELLSKDPTIARELFKRVCSI
jgi:hypothetical protein